MKLRLDRLLMERGLVTSRERGQALIIAGRVLVNDQKIEKAGTTVDENVAIRILGDELPYVSRGGLKLEYALAYWNLDVCGKVCMDIGASTGGFTDCLLQRGAAEVVAVDTGYGQMHLKLRTDSRVRLLEKTNARYLTPEQLWPDSARTPLDVVVIDVSFISATLILPAAVQCALGSGTKSFELITLIKPQFEVGRSDVGKGGIVRSPDAQGSAVRKVVAAVEQLGGSTVEVIDSPILGAEGNREFLLHAGFTVHGNSLRYTDLTQR